MSGALPAPAAGDGPLEQAEPRAVLPVEARALVADVAAKAPNWDGIVLLPGEVTHWVYLSAGEIIGFLSFLSGRIGAVLGASYQPDTEALEATLSRPERLAAQLASAELGGNSDAILGHLLGAELAAARAYWLGREIRIAGEHALNPAYRAALATQAAQVLG